MVEAYPESLTITTSLRESLCICYPIHALLYNEKINNIQEIIGYMLGSNPTCLRVLNGENGTPLHVACQSKNVNLAIVEHLFNAWPEAMQMIDHSGWLPIHEICNNNKIDDGVSLEILQFMLDADPNLPRVIAGDEGYLPIHLAVDRMSVDFCKELIKAYPESVKAGANDDNLPIHEACRFRDRDDAVDTVEYLLQLYPESINASNEDAWLPIHCAAMNESERRTDIVKLLLKYDSDAASKRTESKKRKPLHIASENGHLGATKVLYDAYPQAIFHRDKDGETPITLAKRGRVKRFLKAQVLYVRKSQDMTVVHTPDANGLLPLHHALKDGAPLGSIKLLVEGNPSALLTADRKLAFPLHIACEFSSVQVVKFLFELEGIPVSHLDTNKDSILHYACRSGNLGVVKYLITNHASLVASMKVNINEELPIHLLCEYGKSREDSTQYVETIWLMLLADPEALMS